MLGSGRFADISGRGHTNQYCSAKKVMRIATVILGFIIVCQSARAFFDPFTTEQRVARSTLIAVVEITEVDIVKGHGRAVVVQAIMGSKVSERIEIWDDWRVGDDGLEYRIEGRDPNIKIGKRYLIYLAKDPRGRFVTVQSSLDCLEVVGTTVRKEGAEGFEPLADKLARIRAILAKQKEAELDAAGQPATRPESK